MLKTDPGMIEGMQLIHSKIKNELGWQAEHSFENAIKNTVNWFIENEKWWKEIISGEYQNYYKLQYSSRSL